VVQLRPWRAAQAAVVKAPGECRHSNEVFIELGKRICPAYFDFKDDVEFYDIQLAGLGLFCGQAAGDGRRYGPPGTIGFRKYKDAGGFSTPAKEFISTGRTWMMSGKQCQDRNSLPNTASMRIHILIFSFLIEASSIRVLAMVPQ